MQKMLKETEAEETIDFFVTFLFLVAFCLEGGEPPGLPLATPMLRHSRGAESQTWPGVSSNIEHLRFCELQNRRGKCHKFSQDFHVISEKKKRSSVFHILISQCHFDGPSEAHGPSAGPLEASGPLDGPPKIHGPRSHCLPLPSPLGGPALQCNELNAHINVKTKIYLQSVAEKRI